MKAENEQLRKDLLEVTSQMRDLKLQQSQMSESQVPLSQGRVEVNLNSQADPQLKPVSLLQNTEFKPAKSHISKSVSSKGAKTEIMFQNQDQIIQNAKVEESKEKLSKPKSAKLDDAIS